MTKIMVVDDEMAIRDAFGRKLRRVGYDVALCAEGQEALRLFSGEEPDLVILDIIMPGGMDGLTVCRRIRDISDIPIMMLSAQAMEEQDIVDGLNAGADEYLIKPIGLDELVARVSALIRRAQKSSGDGDQHYDDGYLLIDPQRRHVYVMGKRQHLTPTEYKMLAVLVKNAGRAVAQRDLLEQVWGVEYKEDIYYPRVYISQLRRKIERDPANPVYIHTEHRIGYRFERQQPATNPK